MIEEGVATAAEIDKATRFGLGFRYAELGVVEFIDFGGATSFITPAARWRRRSMRTATQRPP